MHQSQNDRLLLIKRLLTGQAVTCPACGQAELTRLHQKAKKSNLQYVCPACGERFEVLRLMRDLE